MSSEINVRMEKSQNSEENCPNSEKKFKVSGICDAGMEKRKDTLEHWSDSRFDLWQLCRDRLSR